jgi:hypothetical protein
MIRGGGHEVEPEVVIEFKKKRLERLNSKFDLFQPNPLHLANLKYKLLLWNLNSDRSGALF